MSLGGNHERRLSIIRRTANEVRSYKVTMKILSIVLAMLAVVTTVVYGTAVLYKNTGSFTVSIDRYEMMKHGLSLSESRELTHMTSQLNAKIVEDITNISDKEIDKNVDMINGTHNGENYIAYTFYVVNAGENEVSYEYQITLSNVTNSIDEAIRIRLYVDGTPTTYAKTASDGSGAEPKTKEFYSETVAANGRIDSFAPNAVTKFTMVVWIEGTDPDCLDYIIGGEINIDMTMSIAH